MANICENDFSIYGDNEDVIEAIEIKLEKLFEETLDGEITYSDGNIIEGYFSSRWVFPMEIFEDFFKEFNDDTIYMRCLSMEYGCKYIAMNVYIDNNWWKEQTFDF